MDIKKIRIVLVIILLFVCAMLWGRWQDEYGAKAKTQPATQQQTTAQNSQVPDLGGQANSGSTHPVTSTAHAPTNIDHVIAGKTITIKTDVLKLKVSLNGGSVVQGWLLDYPKKLHSSQPVALFTPVEGHRYLAQSGLIAPGLPAKRDFSAQQASYTLAPNQKQLTVNLTWQGDGISLVKSYTLTRGIYAIKVAYHVTNQTGKALNTRFYGQLLREEPKTHHSLLNSYMTYTGAAVSSTSDHYQKVSFGDMQDSNLSLSSVGGWAAMVEHYFIGAWVPNAKTTNQYYSRVYNDKLFAIGVATPTKSIANGQSATLGATLYAGPAIAKELDQVSPNLDLTINYGWLWPISILIFKVMSWIHHYVGNWGWSIILVTLLIKLLFYPLSSKSYHSMARMRQLQPKIAQIKERCGDDKQKQAKATMELYRKEKVSPLGGCLPMVIQIPVFIGLYYMLMASVELRQALWILWIHDLSVHDPYFILPILMGITMYVQQQLNPSMPDPTYGKVMKMMPIVFTVIFLGFPAGLVLYWLVNNLVTILQQWFIMRRVEAKAAKRGKR